MADSQNLSWGLVPRLAVASIAAMVLSLALKPYESQLSPYVKKIKEKALAHVALDKSADGKKHTIAEDKSDTSSDEESSFLESKDSRDKYTDNDRKQLKSVLDNL